MRCCPSLNIDPMFFKGCFDSPVPNSGESVLVALAAIKTSNAFNGFAATPISFRNLTTSAQELLSAIVDNK